MRILISGASGFIGSYFTCHAAEAGHEVVTLSRRRITNGIPAKAFTWELGQQIPLDATKNTDCAIHLAHDFSGSEGARKTFNATLQHISQLREEGVRQQLFFSSYSAGPHATSIYGQTKFALEQELKKYNDVVIIRPGLVIGNGGIYRRIKKWAQGMSVIPLPDGGRGKLPIISIERLWEETLKLIENNPPQNESNLFEPDLYTLRSLVFKAASAANKAPLIIPVPSNWLINMLKFAEILNIPLPVNSDNLAGFLANKDAMHISSLKEN